MLSETKNQTKTNKVIYLKSKEIYNKSEYKTRGISQEQKDS